MLGKDYVPPINSMPFSWSIVANLIGKTTDSWSVACNNQVKLIRLKSSVQGHSASIAFVELKEDIE